MSFLADKKREHESAAEKALATKDHAKAFFHTAKAAEFGFALAEKSDGVIAERYVEDANELLSIAEELKARAKKQDAGKVKKVVAEGADERPEAQSPWKLTERPDTKLADVAGLDEVKEVLRDKVILPFQKPEVYQRFKVKAGAGVLMYGPPGNGKTMFARAIAGELDAAFFQVDASQIKDKYVGETEKNLKRLFEEAGAEERSVLFIDEVDHLLSRRGNQKIGAVTQFLALTDGIVKRDNCMMLLAATNKPWLLDPATLRPGRIGTHVYVGLPDAKAREAIVAYNLRDVPMDVQFDMAAVAAQTDGYSGADLAAVCERAKMAAIRRQLETNEDQVITRGDFAGAITRVKPSVTREHLAEFEQWRDSREKPAGAEDEE